MKNLLFLSDTSRCSVHDKRLADAELRPLLADSWLRQDLSFLGFSPDGVGTLTPFKKPKGDVLTLAQKRLIANPSLCACELNISSLVSNAQAWLKAFVVFMSLEPRMPSWELPVLSIFPSLSFPLATPY